MPGQLVVTFKRGLDSAGREKAVREHRGKVVDRVAGLDVYAVEFADVDSRSASKRAKAGRLKKDGRFATVEPNYIYRAMLTPADPALGQQWAWGTIGAYAAWDKGLGNTSTMIAIVDTGVQRSHPDLDAKIVAGYDYVSGDSAPDDGNGHGTHVAGTAAAETGNSTGGSGTCPNCKVMPLRVLDKSGSGTLTGIANGIRWATDRGAKVINLSLGGPGSSTLQSAVDYATSKGVFLACAAGNSATSSTSSSYPAAYPNCFAVASTTSTDARSSFSNYGGWVEVAAPGTSIHSTWIGSSYSTISGTSMATPHVSGLAGLLVAQGLTASQIRERICRTSDQIAGTGSSWTCGRINADAAVTGTAGSPPPPAPTTEAIVNGGFESGTAPWAQTSSAGYQLIGTTTPRTGSHSAWLGGYNGGTDTISQTVTVPSNGSLTYWWYMTTEESGSTAYDHLRVRLYNSSGSLIGTLRTFSNASGSGAWRQDTLGLAAYAGQKVRVEFAASTDYSLPTNFFVDDVALK